MASKTLTKGQIDNWRKVLVGMIGPYALIASEAEIQAFRDKMQCEVVSDGPIN